MGGFMKRIGRDIATVAERTNRVAFVIGLLRGRRYRDYWSTFVLPSGIPLGIGFVMGLLLALLIARDSLFGALALTLAVPFAVFVSKEPLTALLVWLLLMPMLPFGKVSARVFWVIHRGLIPVALALAIFSPLSRLRGRVRVGFSAADLFMVLYLGVGVVSAIVTYGDPTLDLFAIYDRYFVAFSAYWLLRVVQPGERELGRAMPFLLGLFFAEVAIGFWSHFAPSALPSLWDVQRMGTRMSGTFGNPNDFGYVLLLLMALGFYHAAGKKSVGARLTTFALLGAGSVCVLLTFTRAVWGGAALVIGALALLYPKKIALALLAVAPIVVTLAFVVFPTEIGFASERLHTEQTVDSRVIHTTAGLGMFYSRPSFGWGINSYDLYDWRFMQRVGNAIPSEWDLFEGTSHNTFITILAETGLLGFITFVFPIVWAMIRTVKVSSYLSRQDPKRWHFLIVLWSSALSFLLIGQFVDWRFSWYGLGLFWATLALVTNITQSVPEGTRQSSQSQY
jgi:O-antigen ligase